MENIQSVYEQKASPKETNSSLLYKQNDTEILRSEDYSKDVDSELTSSTNFRPITIFQP